MSIYIYIYIYIYIDVIHYIDNVYIRLYIIYKYEWVINSSYK